MSGSNSMVVDAAKAREIWAEYQRQHDVSDRMGQAVGIDPVSGRIWFGRKALDIRSSNARRRHRPAILLRVGSDFYRGKGGRQCSASYEPDGDGRLPKYLFCHPSGTVGDDFFSWAAVLLDSLRFLRDTSLPPNAPWRFRMSAKMAFTSKLKRAESSSRARRTSATMGSSHIASFSH